VNATLLAASDAGGALGSRPLVAIVAMAALSLLPFALLLVTSFVRIAVVLSIVKSALGTPQIPPASVVTGLALVLTIYVMAPTAERMYAAAGPHLGALGAPDPARPA
jgi:type III secretion protein R